MISHGGIYGYIGNSSRLALGLGLSFLTDGGVNYFAKNKDILKRAVIQRVSQYAYGTLRSYPRYIKYWEQKKRDERLKEKSQTSIANENGQYRQLIEKQKPVKTETPYTDTIVGNVVKDFLELSISKEGSYYDNKTRQIESNSTYGLVTFVDLQPEVQVNGKNNIVQTVVQGRDYSRKEFISGGDLEITINGKITSKYPDIYPEVEVSKFLKLMQYKGILNCDNTILKQFNIKQLIVLNFSLGQSEFRNIQPYSLSCVAVEPSEAVELKDGIVETVQTMLKEKDKWTNIIRIGTEVIDPTSLLKLTQQWI